MLASIICSLRDIFLGFGCFAFLVGDDLEGLVVLDDLDDLDDLGDLDVAGPVGGQASTATGSVDGAGEVGPVS